MTVLSWLALDGLGYQIAVITNSTTSFAINLSKVQENSMQRDQTCFILGC